MNVGFGQVFLVVFFSLDILQTMAEPQLLYLDRYNIRSFDLETEAAKILVSSAFTNAIAMDFHHANQKLYVSDVTQKRLYVINMLTSPPDVTVLLDTGLGVPGGLVVDWVNNNLYWTDTDLDQINVMDLDTNRIATIVDTNLYQPRAIKLDLRDDQRWMYFTDYGFRHGIFRARLDGSDRQTLADTDAIVPNGLTIDFNENKLYWVDGLQKTLRVSSLDGTSVRTLAEGLEYPFSVVSYGGALYWTEWDSLSVRKLNKATPNVIQTITTQVSNKPTAILVYDSSLQPSGTAVCGSDNNGCSHVCLPSRLTTSSCACPSGSALATNEKTCVVQAPTPPPPSDVKLIWAENDDMNLTRLGIVLGDPHVWIDTENITMKHVRSTNILNRFNSYYSAVAFRSSSSEIFMSDNGMGNVQRFVYKPGEKDINFFRVSNTSKQINGLAVDWLSDSVYMTDTLNGRITVCNGHRIDVCRHIVIGLNKPFGIAVHPTDGYMLWTSQGNTPRIEKSRPDGTNRQVLVSGSGKPTGITIDYKTNTFYYVDQLIDTIVHCDKNGATIGDPVQVQERSGELSPLLYDISIYDDILFVTDQANRQIKVINSGSFKTASIDFSNLPLGITVYDPDKQPPGGYKPCESLNCGDICVTTESGSAICLCREDFKLSGDGKNCVSGTETPIQNTSTGDEDDESDKTGILLYVGIGGAALLLLVVLCVTLVCVVACKKSKNPRRRLEGSATRQTSSVATGAAGKDVPKNPEGGRTSGAVAYNHRVSSIYAKIDEQAMIPDNGIQGQGQGYPGNGIQGYNNEAFRASMLETEVLPPPVHLPIHDNGEDYLKPADMDGNYVMGKNYDFPGRHDNGLSRLYADPPPSYETLPRENPYIPPPVNHYAGLNQL